MTTTPSRLTVPAWRIATQAVTAALVAYVMAGTAEVALIRVFQPTEWELAWVSDVMLAGAFGVAVYLWRHLSATRAALLDHERTELVLDTQLALAADLQRRLLPTLPASDGRVEWAADLQSAGKIGGDFYDLVSFSDGRQMLLVADVSGKGIPAAMALSTLRAAFRTIARPDVGPGALLTALSAMLHEQWAGAPYLTAIAVLVDAAGGALRYANAGHPAGVVAGPRGTRTLDSLGPPVALLPGTVYCERAVPLDPGDRCVFVSDGVTEAIGDNAAACLEDLVCAGGAAPGAVHDLCASVMAAAASGSGPDGVPDWQDDRTVVAFAIVVGAREDVPIGAHVVAAARAVVT
ncbi:MAG: PP2C family protein-serine/threonine phosphatase [Acidobacteriota bacterium]